MIIGNCSCADPGIFVRGVQVSLTKKEALTTFFLVLSLIYRSQLVNFKKSIFFQGSRGGPTFSRGGGGQLFPGGGGGVQLLIPIETHITCDFSGGGVRTPCPPPSGSALAALAVAVSVYFSATAI